MLAISEMMERIKGSERSQSISSAPKGAILLNRGEPDFSTPAHIQEAACRAMKNNFTHYGSSRGDEELREAICLSLHRDFGVERKPDEVLVTAGESRPFIPCEGAFYFFPRFAHKKTSREMMQFLAAKGVMVRSGTEFGERGQSRIRISFTISMELLEEGLARMKKALGELE